MGVAGEESTLPVSSEGAQYTSSGSCWQPWPQAESRLQVEWCLPTHWFLFALFFKYGVNQLQVQIWNASLWQPKDMITRALLPLLPRQWWLEPRALNEPGCHLYPLTCPPHPLVSCTIPSVSIGEGLRGGELEALRAMGVGKATEHYRSSRSQYWACRKLEPAQDELGMGSDSGFHF